MKMTKKSTIKAAILGATGFAGEKLVEILCRHPGVEVTAACGIEEPKPLKDYYPRFNKITGLSLEPIVPRDIVAKADVVFLALPHTVSFNYVPHFLAAGKIVIDLSADYRLKDVAVYNKYYGVVHKDVKNIAGAVYGLPEFYRKKIKKAKFIANPGCYPTVSVLSIAPLAAAGLVDEVIIDAKSGATGAGRKANLELNYTSINGNLYAYKIFKHQHLPEIVQTFGSIAGKKVGVIFTPHVVPMEQGILVTVYADLNKRLTREEIAGIYDKFYKNEPFIRLVPGLPKLKDIFNTNFCDIGFAVEGKKIIVVATIDNLVKGAAGQAVQNMNIICGFEEKTGLA